MHVMSSFDLNIARCCIYDNEYLTCEGGLDLIQTFYNEELLQNLDLEGKVGGLAARGTNASPVSDTKWRIQDL